MNTKAITSCVLMLLLWVAASQAWASDTEGCLNCHRYPGLSRLSENKKTLSQFHVDPSLFAAGSLAPHSRLRCTDCHNEAEVEVFPHRKPAPVDCTRACHLDTRDTEINFSHAPMRDALEASVHTQTVLAKANSLIGSPLRPGESACLLCHDERGLVPGAGGLTQDDTALNRCGNCHADSDPRSPRLSYWHVNSRRQPSRSREQVMASCGPCHSDPRIREEFHLPDSVASYFASFHGKAMLLGNQNTAVCLDCHVRSRQNAHLILPKSNPQSSVHPTHAPDTCRSAACHPYAAAGMASAAIHLDLPTNAGVERLVAAVFALLILFTFGPSMAICVLKLIHGAFARHDPEEHHRAELARHIMASPEGRQLLRRFNIAERLQHWLLAVCFTTLVLTGFPIKFADAAWAQWMIDRIGGLPATRILHRGAGVLLLVGLVVHLIYITSRLIAASRKEGRTLKQAVMALPMIPQLSDQKFMLDLVLYLLFIRRKAPQARRFNPEQKFEYLGVFWGTIVLGCTGLLMWNSGWTAARLGGRVITIAALLHTFEAFLALLHVGIVHIVGVIFAPQVFPLSRAMFTGLTPPAGLAEAHAHLVEDARRQLDAPHPPIPSHARGIFRRILIGAYSLGLAAIVVYLSTTAFIYMVRTSFVSTPIPQQIRQWPLPIEAGALRQSGPVAALSAPAGRSPLGHYHHAEPWYRPGNTGGCTTPGCHEPLPHSSKMKVAAFANAHSAFLTCEMCHVAPQGAAPPVWIKAADASPASIPAALRLARFLETNQAKLAEAPADLSATLRQLLRDTIVAQPASGPLDEILRQLDAASPGSPVWRCAVEQLPPELLVLSPGNRGVKLARQADASSDREQTSRMARQSLEYQQAGATRKEELKGTIHAPLLKSSVACASCHSPEGLAFEALGYSPAAVNSLSHLPLARLMDDIRRGQEFHIPRMLKGAAERQNP